MNAKKVTIWGILAALIGLLALEFWTLVNKEEDDTISEVVNAKSKDWLFIPFLLGMLIGHWFWPLNSKKDTK